LDQAEQLYNECLNNDKLFDNSQIEKLETEYTTTTMYFAQLYQTLGNQEKLPAINLPVPTYVFYSL